jgi:[protein-PII] uridylyltransferase
MDTTNTREVAPSASRETVFSDAVEQHRATFHRALSKKVRDPNRRELLETHFTNMPPRYWTRVDETTLRWHLDVLRAFFLHLNRDGANVTAPVLRWRHFPDRGYTEVAVCTWDRLGLLARVAGAFAEVGINILRADIYTRSDNVVLDLFHVCDTENSHVRDEARLIRMRRLLATLFHPERDLALLNRPSLLPVRPANDLAGAEEVTVRWDLDWSTEYAALEVEAADRLGLLYTIFRILAESGLSVAQSVITTENNHAGDVFFVTDKEGRKVSDTALLETTRSRLLNALS